MSARIEQIRAEEKLQCSKEDYSSWDDIIHFDHILATLF